MTTIDDRSGVQLEMVSLQFEKTSTIISLKTILGMLCRIVTYLANRSHQDLSIIGRKPGTLNILGPTFIGRPYVHIIRHTDQAMTASRNERKHSNAIRQILARSTHQSFLLDRQPLPTNARTFDDFGIYLSSSAQVILWSKTGLKTVSENADNNNGHLIYFQQVISEMLEYGIALHQRLAYQLNSLSSPDSVLQARKEIVNFEIEMEEVSQIPEVRDQMISGLEELGIARLRRYIAERLAIQSSKTALNESRTSENIRIGLTIVFGLIATPKFASDVIDPLWQLSGAVRPYDANLYKLCTIAIAVIIIGLLIFLFLRGTKLRSSRLLRM